MKGQLKFALSEAEEANLVKASSSVAKRGIEDLAKLGEVDLPEGWEWRRISDPQVAEMIMGQSPASDTYNTTGDGLPFYQGKGDFGVINPSPRYWCKVPQRIAQKDDILISVRAPVGPTNISTEKCCIGRGLAAIRAKALADNRFIFFYLRSIETEIAALGQGSTFPSITKSQLADIHVPLPPVGEQRRIVERIETFAQRIEEIQILRSEAVEAMNSWILAELNTVFEDLAAEYSTQSLDELFTFRNDVLHPSDKPKGIVRFVGLQHVESNTGRKIGEVILQAEQLEGRKFRFSPGEIVYGYLRPYLNKVWIADCEGLCSVDQYVLKPDRSLIETTYLAYAMRSPYFLSQSKELTGVLMLPRLRSGLLKQIEIPLPPLTEQHRIVAKLDRLQAKAESIRTAQAETQKELDALLPAVLDRAFRGEL